jgi:transcriptional regulator with XRE-family HTH domain
VTPFGLKMRELRHARGITLKRMAHDLQISPAYLSALEHGHRGRPSRVLLRQICSFFNVIWDEAEELHRLAAISHPRVVVDTAGLSPKATELANRIAERIAELDEATLDTVLAAIKNTTPPKS